jgi:gluconokinase
VPYLIGLDIGTSSAKAVAVTTEGVMLAVERRNYQPVIEQQGYHELIPDQVLKAAQSVLAGVQAHAGTKPLGISLSAAMHGLMAVNEKGKPLSNLITWADTRSAGYAAELRTSTTGAKIYERTGTPLHPMSPLCKLAWLADYQPAIFQKAFKFVSIKEYLLFKWFGEWAIDYSIASATGLFDHARLRWYHKALDFAGATPERLSQPVPPVTVFTKWEKSAARKSGISGKVPVVIGASDGCLANLGELAVSPGEATVTIGTSAAVRISGHRAVPDEQGRIFNYLLTEGLYVTGGASNNGGNALEWLSQQLMKKSPEAVFRLAKKAPPGAGGLFFFPWLYGERAPVWNAAAKGFFANITAVHGQPHFCRAVMEGVLLNLALIAQTVEEPGSFLHTIYANGGFTRSPFWVQMLANVFGKKVLVRETADSAAFGAVILGMKALGIIQSFGDARYLLPAPRVFEPVVEASGVYRLCLRDFKRMSSEFGFEK